MAKWRLNTVSTVVKRLRAETEKSIALSERSQSKARSNGVWRRNSWRSQPNVQGIGNWREPPPLLPKSSHRDKATDAPIHPRREWRMLAPQLTVNRARYSSRTGYKTGHSLQPSLDAIHLP